MAKDLILRLAKGKNALGLISMRERARLVNGNFTIRSEYGKGTLLEVSEDKLKRRQVPRGRPHSSRLSGRPRFSSSLVDPLLLRAPWTELCRLLRHATFFTSAIFFVARVAWACHYLLARRNQR